MTEACRPITGEEVARSAAADFEAFFLPGWSFQVPIHFGPVGHPCIRKSGRQTRIVLPKDMAADVIDGPDRLFFHLLMIGHEIAHLVHRHLDDPVPPTEEDDHCLELWADFYGAKVAMALVTLGPRTHTIAHKYFPNGELMDALESIGGAAGTLVRTVYRKSRRYPDPLDRVGLISNGVTSFLRHDLGPRFDSRLYYSIFKRVFSAPNVRELMLLEGHAHIYDEEPLLRAKRWHRKMQGNDLAITSGFRPEVLDALHTSFGQTEEEIRESARVRREEMVAAGYLAAED